MANPTTNYSFQMPTNTDLVKDLPADFEVFGQAVDTQMKTNADAAIAKTIVDAKGDIIAATAADTVSRLAVGANDTVLTADSSTATGLKWAAPASGGMTLISTTSLTGASVTLSSIPSTYNDLMLVVRNYRPGTANGELKVRVNNDSGTRYSNTSGGTINENQAMSQTGFQSGREYMSNGVSSGLEVWRIYNYNNTTTWKIYNAVGAWQSGGTQPTINMWCGMFNQTGAITSLVCLPATGSFTSGEILLYGVK